MKRIYLKSGAMKHGFLPLGAVILLLAMLSFYALPYSGNVVTDASNTSLSLELDSDEVLMDEVLDGTLALTFNDTVSSEENITISINSENKTYALKDLLDKQNYSPEYADTELTPTNGEATKEIIFTKANSSAYVGFEVPRFSDIDALSFALSAGAYQNVYPSSVTIDMGGEGTVDWEYLGTFLGYSTKERTSEDLETSAESNAYVTDDSTYFCETISLPKTKDLTVKATYTKVSSSGDIAAIVLSFPTGDPENGWAGGGDTCNLPEESGSCTIHFEYPIEGEYLVCIYSTKEATGDACTTESDCPENNVCDDDICHEILYELAVDSGETDTAFTCPTSAGSYCKATDFSNFFISAYAGTYDTTMKGTIDISEGETFPHALLTGAQYYVGSDPYKGLCKKDLCVVPINITSENNGTLTFSNFVASNTYNDVTQDIATLYDLTWNTPNISAIESKTLEDGATIDIPLKSFDLSFGTTGTYTLKVTFLGKTVSDTVRVVEESETSDAQAFLGTAIDRYESMLDSQSEDSNVLALLEKTREMESALKELKDLRAELGFVDDADIVASAEEILNDMPWDIKYSDTTTSLSSIKPSDIPSTFGDAEEIYDMQDAIKVAATKRAVEVETYAGATESYTLIKKKVTAEQSFSDATLYEIAPVDFDEMQYITSPEDIDGRVATYTVSLEEGASEEYLYLTQEEVSIEDFMTILVEEKAKTECGDGTCSIPDEDINSCPEDCGEETPYVWFALLGVAILAAAITIFILLRKKPNVHE